MNNPEITELLKTLATLEDISVDRLILKMIGSYNPLYGETKPPEVTPTSYHKQPVKRPDGLINEEWLRDVSRIVIVDHTLTDFFSPPSGFEQVLELLRRGCSLYLAFLDPTNEETVKINQQYLGRPGLASELRQTSNRIQAFIEQTFTGHLDVRLLTSILPYSTVFTKSRLGQERQAIDVPISGVPSKNWPRFIVTESDEQWLAKAVSHL